MELVNNFSAKSSLNSDNIIFSSEIRDQLNDVVFEFYFLQGSRFFFFSSFAICFSIFVEKVGAIQRSGSISSLQGGKNISLSRSSLFLPKMEIDGPWLTKKSCLKVRIAFLSPWKRE